MDTYSNGNGAPPMNGGASAAQGPQFQPFHNHLQQGLQSLRPEELAMLQQALTGPVLDIVRRLLGDEFADILAMFGQVQPTQPAAMQQPMARPQAPVPMAAATGGQAPARRNPLADINA